MLLKNEAPSLKIIIRPLLSSARIWDPALYKAFPSLFPVPSGGDQPTSPCPPIWGIAFFLVLAAVFLVDAFLPFCTFSGLPAQERDLGFADCGGAGAADLRGHGLVLVKGRRGHVGGAGDALWCVRRLCFWSCCGSRFLWGGGWGKRRAGFGWARFGRCTFK